MSTRPLTLLLRGLRVIDPLAGVDRLDQDVRIEDGRITAIAPRLDGTGADLIDLSVPDGVEPRVLCPGFIDLHAHLRDPGDGLAETLETGAAAASAGGFTQVVAMANTDPPIDTPERVAAVRARAGGLPVRVVTAAALTCGLAGDQLVDIEGCAAAGAAAFTDDGRNAAPTDLLVAGLRAAAPTGRAVLVHPEDESLIARGSALGGDVVRCSRRPPVAESAAVEEAVHARAVAGVGTLHLQHLSTHGSLELLERARVDDIPVTGEATPHHLALSLPLPEPASPASLTKVNPPLRPEADRLRLVEALGSGLISAIATDHAPHPAAAKGDDYDAAAPGMIGLETALPLALAAVESDPEWLAIVIERLTAGPYRVLAGAGDPTDAGITEPRLRLGEPADAVVLDPSCRWRVAAESLRSRSANTPLRGAVVRGRVLLTLAGGAVVHAQEPFEGRFEERFDA